MNEYHSLETVYIKDEISRCEDIEELKEKIFPLLRSQKEDWARKINEIFSEGKYKKIKFAELCGVSRQAVGDWFKGTIPKSRETFLRIGMAAGYNVEKMNQLLQRYGRYPGLYSKSLEDCVCIYVINHAHGEEAVDKYKYILNKIKERIIRGGNVEEMDNVSTVKFDSKLSKVEDEDGLEQFISDNAAVFANAYHKLYAYVKMTINANYIKPRYAESVFEMAEVQGWRSSLRQCVSEIRQGRWYPTRNKIISLGLHLSMDHEQIDEMLELAHMEPLCGKNILESVIMFILDDASLKDMLTIISDDFDPDSHNPEELCYYARDVLSQLDLPEVKDFILELPENYDRDSELSEVDDV